MPLAEFIITGFCWVETPVDAMTQTVKRRQRGYPPRWSDAEVITMAIVGELLGYPGDKAIGEYVRRPWAGWLPGLGDRTTFSRQAANLGGVKQQVQERRVAERGAATDTGHVRDGFPIAVCKLARAVRSPVLKAAAAYGDGAAKADYYSGLKGQVMIDRRGVVTAMTVTAANVDERDAAYDLLGAIEGLLMGDKGYIRPQFKADGEALGLDLPTPVRQNRKASPPRWCRRLAPRVRQRVETVIAQLEPRFGLAVRRARDTWHLTNRVARKLLAHTLAVWLNLRLGREPLAFDGLVTA